MSDDVTRSTMCVCGGRIRAAMGDEQEAVTRHNATDEHQKWRAEGGMDKPAQPITGPAQALRHALDETIVIDGKE